MKQMLFIMNPCAGMKKANRYYMQLVDLFTRSGYRVTAHITQGQGDAAQVAQELAPQMDAVVCCGGDGTFNETLSGVMAAGTNTPIGYIPAGSTNDFAASLGLSSDLVAAATAIVEGSVQPYDAGRFADRYFSYVASFGAFTKVSYNTPQSIKNALGHTAYLLEGIQELSQIRKHHVKLILDGAEVLEDDYLFGAICNSTSVGGIMSLDPNQVDLQDGKFEVLLIRSPRTLQEIPECLLAVQKQQYNSTMMTFKSASCILIEADPAMAWSLDGEKCDGSDRIQITNLHEAIQIIK